MSDSLGEEICERIMVELMTGRVIDYGDGATRVMVPSFGLANGTGSSIGGARQRLWTPYGCLWVGNEVGL